MSVGTKVSEVSAETPEVTEATVTQKYVAAANVQIGPLSSGSRQVLLVAVLFQFAQVGEGCLAIAAVKHRSLNLPPVVATEAKRDEAEDLSQGHQEVHQPERRRMH